MAGRKGEIVGFQTDCASTGEDHGNYHGSIPPPIYESSLFTFPTYAGFRAAQEQAPEREEDSWLYSRIGNPTTRVLERKLALLEGGDDCRVFASGMAAITAALLSSARSGDHVLAVRSIYSNAHRLIDRYLPTLGIETAFADFTDLDAVERAVQPNTRVLYLESPGNPAMQLIDLEAVAAMARRLQLTTIIDATMATPYNQRPLALGIDLVVHSASKYLSGHSDVIAGAVIGDAGRLARLAADELRDLGGALPPFEAWLVLRGVRTLGLRMQAHNNSAQRIAGWLEGHEAVERVFYPGLASHPQHDLARRQMSGYSGMVSLVVRGGAAAAEQFVNTLTLFGIAVSWGGFESLALPIEGEPWPWAADLGIVPGFVRLSIGLEDTSDLIADLDSALRKVNHD